MVDLHVDTGNCDFDVRWVKNKLNAIWADVFSAFEIKTFETNDGL